MELVPPKAQMLAEAFLGLTKPVSSAGKMSSPQPWIDRRQSLFDFYLKLDWLALGGISLLS